MYVPGMTDEELLAAACPMIGTLGSLFYFAPETVAVGEAHGLDRSKFYFLGRGGVLGDVDASVVSAAWGYFNPAVVKRVWDGAREVMSPRAGAALYFECAADLGRRRLQGVEGLDAFNAAAAAVIAAGAAHADSMPLFAGIAAEPRVADAEGLAMQAIVVLREFRGSAHLLALRAVGLPSKLAHFVARPGDGRMFGWAEGDTPEIDDAHRALRAEAEALTDRIVRPAFAVLDQAQRAAFVGTLQHIAAALA
ncbi:MAG: hypothetical protein RI900_2839 [Actinomycetota bacterium]|jgi:hypothetical protein